MFDEFRQDAENFSFDDELETEGVEDENPRFRHPAAQPKRLLGMTPAQRFVIAVLLLMMTCILSSFFLLVTERIAPPFLS